MNADGPAPLRLVSLFPHDDAAAAIHAYRRKLFAAGVLGALSLPLCVPLFRAEAPLTKQDLKQLAAALRETRTEPAFFVEQPRCQAADKSLEGLFGDRFLACPVAPSWEAASSPYPLIPPVLPISDASEPDLFTAIEDPFPFRFRAAYVCNLLIRPIAVGEPRLSFEWELGAPAWLPK